MRCREKNARQSGHGGNLSELAQRIGLPPGSIIDFSASINPLGPPDCLRKAVSSSVEKLVHYPDPGCGSFRAVLAASLRVDENQLVAANGSTEIIHALPQALTCRRAVIPVPSYLDYERASVLAGLAVRRVPLFEKDGFELDFSRLGHGLQKGDLVYLARPNNPTGVSFPAHPLLELAQAGKGVHFAVDESFFEFVDSSSELLFREMPANLIVFRSLTKFYAIPGLRLGYAVSAPETIELLRQHIMPWTVNTIAQEMGRLMVADADFGERSRTYVKACRRSMREQLSGINGLRVFPGAANYLLVKLEGRGMGARCLADRLLALPGAPMAIRVCDTFADLDGRYFRVAVRGAEENERLCEAIADELGVPTAYGRKRRRKTPALMLQGTSSNAGKSILTAALCRIFLQDGFRVAPFKAQNMSLNSYVTRDGGEMGRAQVVQAQACRLDPDVRMNPVLLKPSSEVGSQVIVNGRPVGNMSVEAYIDYKPVARDAAFAAYDSLASEYDILLLEGAGSPAEVNLKKHDIVNMNMARYAGASVLLVGDIDRGGVFASFIGTLEVMAEWERRLVAGFLVNRFRGRASLLNDAFEYVKDFTNKPVLGTIPYIRNLGLPEEDSVSFKAGLYEEETPGGEYVTIGVIDLPHISNFTDVEPFLAEPDAHLVIIRTAAELAAFLPGLAALVLPGSKNVINDLDYLRQSGIARRIIESANTGGPEIIGICGGFQMLGKEIADPLGIESGGCKVEALGILEMTTALAAEKTLTRQTAVHLRSGHKVHGYEIHHGRTHADLGPVVRLESGKMDGMVSCDGRVWGTYLHGIFDDDTFRRWFLDKLRCSRGFKPLEKVVAPYNLEPAFDRLADIVRNAVDMNKIYELLRIP